MAFQRFVRRRDCWETKMAVKHNIDPIVAEVRKARAANAAKFDFDVRQIVAEARRRQEQSEHRILSSMNAQ